MIDENCVLERLSRIEDLLQFLVSLMYVPPEQRIAFAQIRQEIKDAKEKRKLFPDNWPDF